MFWKIFWIFYVVIGSGFFIFWIREAKFERSKSEKTNLELEDYIGSFFHALLWIIIIVALTLAKVIVFFNKKR